MNDVVVEPALPIDDKSTDTVARHTQSTRVEGKSRNLYIQWLRAIAATLVVFYHAAIYQGIIRHDDTLAGVFPGSLGMFGVGLFFAISGYLMSIAVRVQSPAVFMAHRVIRIYPLYFVATAVFFLLSLVSNELLRFDFDPWALALMPLANVSYSLMRVEWTLVFEITFYVCLFVLALLGLARHIGWIALGWLVVLGCASVFLPINQSRLQMPIYQMLLVSPCVPMAGGLMIPYLLRLRIPAWLLLAVAGAGWVILLSSGQAYVLSRWLLGGSAVFTVWGMVSLSETSRILHLGRAGRALARYGDYSYALYLCHVPILCLIIYNAGRLSAWPLWCLCVAAAILVATGAGYLDVTLYYRLKTWLKTVPPRFIRWGVTAYFVAFAAASATGSYEYYWNDRLSHLGGDYAASMLAIEPILTNEDALQAATAAGYTPSSSLAGNIDLVTRVEPGGRLYVDAWGLDRSPGKSHMIVDLFRQGALLASFTPTGERADVSRAYAKTGDNAFHYELAEACNAAPLVAVLFTPDRHFLVLPNAHARIVCPP